MRISEGNIFEAMRLVLPEHRAKMNDFEREMHKAHPPTLAVDKQNDMHYVLEAAIANGRKVQVTLYGPDENCIVTGVPSIKGGKLFLTNRDGVHRLLTNQLIDVEEI
jgi:hypothetical protein